MRTICWYIAGVALCCIVVSLTLNLGWFLLVGNLLPVWVHIISGSIIGILYPSYSEYRTKYESSQEEPSMTFYAIPPAETAEILNSEPEKFEEEPVNVKSRFEIMDME